MTDLAIAIKAYMQLKTDSGEQDHFIPLELSTTPEFSSFDHETLRHAMDEIVAGGYADVDQYIQPSYFLV